MTPPGQGTTKNLFGHTACTTDKAGVPLVDIGRIDKVYSLIEGVMNELNRFGLAYRRTKGHRPQADWEYIKVCVWYVTAYHPPTLSR